MNLCPGKSVGAVIRDKDGAILVLYRKKRPLGLALPAGHIDEGETPPDAMQREVYEETGLEVKRYREVLHSTFPNPCSRTDAAGKSYDGHEWWVYEVVEWSGVPRLMEPDKHEFVGFQNSYLLEQIIAPRRGFTPTTRRKIYNELENRANILKKLHERGLTNFYEFFNVLSKAYREGLFR